MFLVPGAVSLRAVDQGANMAAVHTTRRRLSYAGAMISVVASLLLVAGLPAQGAMQTDDGNPTLTVDYDAEGSTHIGAGVNTDMQIGPTTLSSTIDLITT